MASTLGLTRSKGSVSHAGKSSTSSGRQELLQVVGQALRGGPGRDGDEQG